MSASLGLDGPGPDPNLMLVGWGTETDSHSAFGPGESMPQHQLLDTVLPYDPGGHLSRNGRCADRELAQLFRLQAPGLAQGDAGTFGHASMISNVCPRLKQTCKFLSIATMTTGKTGSRGHRTHVWPPGVSGDTHT